MICGLADCLRNPELQNLNSGANGVWSSAEVVNLADEAVTVVKLQVGLLGTARQLKRDLERIAGRADTNTPDGLHYILQGTCSP